MSFNGSGTFVVNSSGQPVVTGTVISSTAFNALTADLATGLSTCVTKDGQTATTVRVPFAFGINSTLTTDATSATTGSIITAGGISMQKALWVGTTSRHVGATQFDAAITYGGVTLSNAVTGTGNMVLSASPTLTGTLTAAALTTSGTVAINSNANSLQTVVLQNTNAGAAAITGLTVRNSSSYDLALQSLSAAFPPSGFYRAGGQIIYATAVGGLTLVTGTASGQPIYFYPGETLSLTLAASGAATFASSVTATLFTPTATGNNGLGLAAANTPAFYASTTEVMRSTTALVTVALATTFSSTVKIGTASTIQTGGEVLSVLGTGTVQNASTSTVLFVTSNQAGDCLFLNFKSGSGGAGNDRGSVTYNSSTGLVVYNTTSDYRLKTLFGEYSGCGEVIDALQIHVGLMKGATMKRPMFVAHEVQKIVPEAVTGEKDAVDKDGNIIAQQLDATSLVPYLVAEVKMLRGRVRDLENKRRVA